MNEWLVVSWIFFFFFFFMDWTASDIRTPHFVIIYLHTYIPNYSSIFFIKLKPMVHHRGVLVFKISIRYGMDNKYNMNRPAFSLVVGI